MIICVFSPIYEISELLCESIENLGETCLKFRTTSLLIDFLKATNHNIDLLILDYTTYNHEIFSLRRFLEDINMLFPIIFFNDPCPSFPKRTDHWIEHMKLLYNIQDEEKLEEYKSIFAEVEEIVEAPELRPYIPLMVKPLPFPKQPTRASLIRKKLQDNTSISVYNFKKRNNLSNNLFYLLQIFYDNRDKALSLEDIIKIYELDNKKIAENSLAVSISRLKSILSKDSECHFFIQENNKKYRIIIFE